MHEASRFVNQTPERCDDGFQLIDLLAQPLWARYAADALGDCPSERACTALLQAYPLYARDAKRSPPKLLPQDDFPASALFRSGSPRLRQGREALLGRLAESLRKGPEGAPRYLLEILVGIGSEAAVDVGATTGPASLELRRAAVLAARLSAEGAPLDGLSTGLRSGAAGSLRFVVRLRPDSGAAAGSGAGED